MAGHGVGVAFGGTLRVDLKSQSLVIESFSVGSRTVLSTMGEGFSGSRFKVLYGPTFWGHKGNNMCGGIYCRFWHTRKLNHLKQQHKALRQASQLCSFGLQMQLSLFSDVGPLETIAENKCFILEITVALRSKHRQRRVATRGVKNE